MRVVRGLVEEEVVHDDAFHRREAGRDMLGVGVGLQDVLALDVDALEGAVDGGVEHVGDAQAGLVVELHAPQALVDVAHRVAGDVAIARQFVREGAHVAGALHVVLAAQRVHADAWPADIAGRHGEVGDGDDGGRALAVLGDAEAVIDRAIAAGGVEPRRAADQSSGSTPDSLPTTSGLFSRHGDERGPVLELRPVAALADERFVEQAFGDDDMRQRRDDGDIGAGLQRQMIVPPRHAPSAPCRCGADRARSAWRPGAAASSAARRTPDAPRPDWRR